MIEHGKQLILAPASEWRVMRGHKPTLPAGGSAAPRLAGEGFSDKWAMFRLPAATSPTGMRPDLEQIIADSRRVIAAQSGRPESAVRISIDAEPLSVLD